MLYYTAIRISFSASDPSNAIDNPPAVLGVFKTCSEARAAIEKQMLEFDLDFKMTDTAFTIDFDKQEVKTGGAIFKWWWKECELKG